MRAFINRFFAAILELKRQGMAEGIGKIEMGVAPEIIRGCKSRVETKVRSTR